MAPHPIAAHRRAKAQETAQLLTDRELLLRENHSGMLPSGVDPLSVKPVEIGNVECIHHAPALGGKGQVRLVRLLDETRIRGRDHRHTAGSKGP